MAERNGASARRPTVLLSGSDGKPRNNGAQEKEGGGVKKKRHLNILRLLGCSTNLGSNSRGYKDYKGIGVRFPTRLTMAMTKLVENPAWIRVPKALPITPISQPPTKWVCLLLRLPLLCGF